MLTDHILVAVIVLLSPLVDLWLYPRFVRATAAGWPPARPLFYAFGILVQWSLAGCVLASWVYHGRDWNDLALPIRLALPLAVGLILATSYIGLLWTQRRPLFARPDSIAVIRRAIGTGAPMMPRTPGERTGFMLLSITAGVCEELLYRGYLFWYGQLWMNPVSAFVATCVAFGAAHLYLGVKHFGRTAIIGAAFGLVVVVSGSLWPAIVMHVATDILAGDLGFRAFRDDVAPRADAATRTVTADPSLQSAPLAS
jgi:membrane protease YdiL (CAAX protease family)